MKVKSKKNSNFDSLAFKEQAQKRLYLETKGMTWKEQVDYLRRKTLAGPFAHLFKTKEGRGQAVHEEQAVYAQKKIFASIHKRKLGKKLKPGTPDSTSLLREDRGR